jgi:hypothetical protein
LIEIHARNSTQLTHQRSNQWATRNEAIKSPGNSWVPSVASNKNTDPNITDSIHFKAVSGPNYVSWACQKFYFKIKIMAKITSILQISLFLTLLIVGKFILLISRLEEIEKYKEKKTITALENVYINQSNLK